MFFFFLYQSQTRNVLEVNDDLFVWTINRRYSWNVNKLIESGWQAVFVSPIRYHNRQFYGKKKEKIKIHNIGSGGDKSINIYYQFCARNFVDKARLTR